MPKLRDIARALGVDEIPNEADREIERVATLGEAGPADLVYITSDRYAERLAKSRAGVVVAPVGFALPEGVTATVLRVKDAELAIAQALVLFAPPAARPAVGVHPAAVIDDSATLGEGVRIGPNVSVAPRATIGRGTTLHAGVVVGQDSVVGADCELFPNVVLRERVTLGDRVVLHANCSIGSDGFGFRWDGTRHAKIPQIGTVILEDDVEVGSNTCIDRAKFGETRIGRGTKIDNLVQIGHNVRTGMHCILCGQTGIAGSVTLGNGVIMGGNSAATNHVNIADRTTVAARGGIGNDTKPGEILAGAPAVPHREWLKERAGVARLPELIKAVRRLEAEVAALKKTQGPPNA